LITHEHLQKGSEVFFSLLDNKILPLTDARAYTYMEEPEIREVYVGNENPWTVLMLDNPFGSASGSHVLDPIFEIANKLNFQIIAFAAPEIIKAEISERFPVFWALNIGDEESGKSGVVTGRVIHGGRVNKV